MIFENIYIYFFKSVVAMCQIILISSNNDWKYDEPIATVAYYFEYTIFLKWQKTQFLQILYK